MRKTFLVVLSVLFAIVIKSQNYTFSQTTYTAIGSLYPTKMLSGDINNDGKADLLVVEDQYKLTSYLQSGGSFNVVQNTYTATPDVFIIDDFTNDGNKDALSTNKLYLGDGTGTFSVSSTNQTFNGMFNVSADFNGDSNKDIASLSYGNTTSSLLKIYTGLGTGNFNTPTTYSIVGSINGNIGGYEGRQLELSDFNNDSFVDLAIATSTYVSGSFTSTLSIFKGNGDATFTAINSYTYNFEIYSLRAGEVNSDGNKDLVFNTSNKVTAITGDGGFGFTTYFTSTISSTAINLTDMNNDGRADIVNTYKLNGMFCNFTSTISVLNNTGTSFTVDPGATGINPIEWGLTDVICEDFNGDSKIDLAVNTYSCTPTRTICYNTTPALPMTESFIVSPASCSGQCNGSVSFTINGGTPSYTVSLSNGSSSVTSGSMVIGGLCSGAYTYSITDLNNNIKSNVFTVYQPTALNIISSVNSATVCSGSCENLFVAGLGGTPPYSYSWTPNISTVNMANVCPVNSTTYTAFVTDGNGCAAQTTIEVVVDNTCADVWPGDANSDGTADNLDVLELGLHYTQTGAPRASVSNTWQSYFSNNWTGTITNGKNINHSDCNGDGTINDNDTLAIYTNYGLTHAFKPAQTTTVNPQLSIVPDQASVVKGTWGTASVYLGDATTNINNINGLAFTVDFDNTLIEANSIYIEYQPSFIDASQNLHFRKLDFATGKIFTATTHTTNNNVSGFGKIATLHYQIKASLTSDVILNLGITQANQSDASGVITPLTSGTGTLMAMGSSVGLLENTNGSFISISPNPTNGLLTINSRSELQKIEFVSITGALLLSEIPTATNYVLHLENFSNGIYFVNVYQNDRVVKREKVVLNK